MGNRNKRKGFFKEMLGVRGRKTIFGDDSGAPREESGVREETTIRPQEDPLFEAVSEERHYAHGNSYAQRNSYAHGNWAVPPSQLASLPSNVFVTSADFTRARPRRQANGSDVETYEGEADLVNGSADDLMGGLDKGRADEDALWKRVELGFDALDHLTSDNAAMVCAGALIAWKVRQHPFRHNHQLKLAP